MRLTRLCAQPQILGVSLFGFIIEVRTFINVRAESKQAQKERDDKKVTNNPLDEEDSDDDDQAFKDNMNDIVTFG